MTDKDSVLNVVIDLGKSPIFYERLKKAAEKQERLDEEFATELIEYITKKYGKEIS